MDELLTLLDVCPLFFSNLVNGTYSCQNQHTLTHHLKGLLNFSGWVVSDWGADHDSVASLNAGTKHWVDNNQEGPLHNGRLITSSVVNDRTNFELYYQPFEAAIKAGAGSIMCS